MTFKAIEGLLVMNKYTFLSDEATSLYDKYKDDNTKAEKVSFFILLGLNVLLVLLAFKNLYSLLHHRNDLPIKKLVLFNLLIITVIACKTWLIGCDLLVLIGRLAYESDAIIRVDPNTRDGLEPAVYLFFGITSVILFDTLMVLCAYYWYDLLQRSVCD